MRIVEILKLIGCVVVCEAAGIVGAATTATGSSPWYQTLRKPAFNPPSWVFGPVWTLLYLLMGIAVWMVWRKGWDRWTVRRAIIIFAIQLLLNAIWTPIFFGLYSPGGALAVIVTLWAAIIAAIAAFWPVSRGAALLMIPYLLWVTFATVLNGAIYWLNRGT